jgi:1-deoxy-D-xylulose-5-phosphate reductoisomerase
MKKKIAILGSTGSIGNTLINILRKDKKNIEIILLTAHKNNKKLLNQVKSFNVKNIIITDKKTFNLVKKKTFSKKINIYNDFKSLPKIFKNKRIDYVMSSISGLEGLSPTLKIIKFTKKIAIANKESIICAWPLINKELKKFNVNFVPIDSEHFSIHSLLGKKKKDAIEKVFITASGGPFNELPIKNFNKITTESALKHPNWKMGKKITIDSATLMNKVFEIIEAKKIFDLDYKSLDILVHPKSYVHALIKFKNGLTKILIHDTNMIIPIFNSLYTENKKFIKTKKLNFSIINNLNFKKVDEKKFPSVKILKLLPNNHSLFETLIVSANDILVEKFLQKKIKFTDISSMLMAIVKNKKFLKFKQIKPKKVEDIVNLSNYVRLKINSLSI